MLWIEGEMDFYYSNKVAALNKLTTPSDISTLYISEKILTFHCARCNKEITRELTHEMEEVIPFRSNA